MIFYESPYRLKETLANMITVFGEERQTVICRELTKRYEEFIRGSARDVLEWLDEIGIKGEICLLVAGNPEPEVAEVVAYPEDLKQHVTQVMAQENISSKDAIKQVAKIRSLKKQEVYQAYHEI